MLIFLVLDNIKILYQSLIWLIFSKITIPLTVSNNIHIFTEYVFFTDVFADFHGWKLVLHIWNQVHLNVQNSVVFIIWDDGHAIKFKAW